MRKTTLLEFKGVNEGEGLGDKEGSVGRDKKIAKPKLTRREKKRTGRPPSPPKAKISTHLRSP